MQKNKKSAKKLMLKGIFQVLWGELKTINRDKLSGLSKILSGYLRIKYRRRKKSLPAPARKEEHPSQQDAPLTY